MAKLKSIISYGPALIIAAYIWYSIQLVWSIWVQAVFYGGIVLTLVWIFLNINQIKTSFRQRTTQYGANTFIMVLLVIGILGMVNYLAKRYHQRWDLTSTKQYSVSNQTEKIVEGLKDDVEIIHFGKEPNPTLEDLMKEYQSLNRSSLVFRRVDPQANPGLSKKYGVSQFGEILVISGNKHEKIESPREEDITNTILKVTREQNKVIYFTKGHNEADIDDDQNQDGYGAVKDGVKNQNYEVKSINLAESRSIPDDCSALVIAGPKVALLPTEMTIIEKYVDTGVKILLLTDPDIDLGLDKLLKKWKIGLENDIVVDSSGLGQLFGMGPAAPLVSAYESHPITKDLSNTMTFFPEARSLRTVENSTSEFSASVLFRTSERSWGEKNLVEGAAEFNEGIDIEGPVVLGMVSTRSLNLSTEAKPSEEKSSKKNQDDKNKIQAEKKELSKESRVVVIGDSDFANNTFFRNQRNGDLFLNIVSWLAEDEDLISVRPKDQENRSVQMTAATSKILFYLTLVLMPGAALGSGALLVWRRRRSS